MKNFKVICIICARGGSKALKNKNLRKVNSRPLIAFPIIAAIKSKVIDDILVSTDSKKIKKVAEKYGAKVPFLRPKNLSGDLATTEDTLRHALLKYEKIVKFKYDICVFLTATDIFRKITWIKNAVNILKNNARIESVFSGHVMHKNFWEMKNGKWKRLKYWMKIYKSRQVKKFIVREDTGLTCASRARLWRNSKRIGNVVEILINKESFTGIDIHTKDDLYLANSAYKKWKF